MENKDENLSLFDSENKKDNTKKTTAYQATSESLDGLFKDFSCYPEIYDCIKEGVCKVELKKRYMLKVIDEVWVRAIEDTLPALDTIIRHPGVLLQEREAILPIELTRKVTGRSVEHLSQHTDYINEIRDDGTVVPSKLLNIFQDETYLTYENKFINTLLARLYGFISIRFDKAQECGEDEKNTTLSLNQEFNHGETHAKISLSIEVSESPREHEVVKNYIYTSDLWKRVQHIRKVVLSLIDSPFIRNLGKNYVRPPVMRTNMLLKNVDFRQCLALWEFLEGYENTGYESLIQENLEDVKDECLHDFYNSIISQYVLFQKHITNSFDFENTLDQRQTDEPIKPFIKDVLDEFNIHEYDVEVNRELDELTEDDDKIEYALQVALYSDDLLFKEDEDKGIDYRYRFSFLARLILAQNPTQDYYTQIKNELLSYGGVKSKVSWNHDAFRFGRYNLAKMNVKGKTLYLYLPLKTDAYDKNKYHQIDVSEKKVGEDLPFLIKIRSKLAVKRAIELIAEVMLKYGTVKTLVPELTDYHMLYKTPDEMCDLNPPLAKRIGEDRNYERTVAILKTIEEGENETQNEVEIDAETLKKGGINYRYRYSFTARLILAQNPCQDYYSEIKNTILSYNGVKYKTSWNHESYHEGKNQIARINVKGKTLFIFLPLNPENYDKNKYHHIDLTGTAMGEDLPFLFKVKSKLAVKRAKQLIKDVMDTYKETLNENAEVNDYHIPYMSAENMCDAVPPLAKRVGENKTARAFKTVQPKIETESESEIAVGLEKDGIDYRYRYSFTARLILAQNPCQTYYSEIKNHILSYKNVKSKTSWNHDAYHLGKNQVARINVKGRTLFVYLPLNPSEYDVNKYHHIDLSTKKKNADFPFLLKVRSNRATKYAMELLDTVFGKLNAEKTENLHIDYHIEYMTVDKMLTLDKPIVKTAKKK